MSLSVGYLGPTGTFSQEALKLYINQHQDKTFQGIPFANFSLLLNALEIGEIDEAIVPIENSLEGPINTILDKLAFEPNLFINYEVICPVTQCLVAPSGTKISNIKHVISHPQPIGQCVAWVNKNLPNADIVYSNSTAEGAIQVSQGIYDAVIGSRILAETYGLEIIESHIEDNNTNRTRFVTLSKSPSENKTGQDKTSIVFSVDNKPGRLFRILEIFNLWDINMARIESRPSKQQLGEYIFFIDLIGHITDPDIADALKMVKRKSSTFKFIGSFPSAKESIKK